MSLAPRTRLGPYEILAPIGAGGMGTVYRGRDTRLDRIVAIKVSNEDFSERFEREARAIAALNHSNICQIYDVATSSDGFGYLVMEYVEGSPVAPVDSPRKLLDIAVQIADGLAAAHNARIIHRDLKPDNILLTREGKVKILDFGLAKTTLAIGADDPTARVQLTDPGTTLGTIAYMSPEQARGNSDLTPQSDQFSLGMILYELASGKRAFQRESAVETMTAIIREDAEPLPASVPVPLRWLIDRLLAKEPAERYDSTRDLYRELRQIRERLSESTSSSQLRVLNTAQTPTKLRRVLPGIGIAAVGLAAGIMLARLLMPPAQADLSSYRFTAIDLDENEKNGLEWSPDGKSIAYVKFVHGVPQIFTRVVGGTGEAQLTRETGISPFWSPDGATIYYTYRDGLWAIAASGGAPERVLEDAGNTALHPDGKTVVFGRGGKAWIGSLKGGTPQVFWWQPPEPSLVTWRRFSPDGSKMAVLDGADLWIVPYQKGAPRRFATGGLPFASWLPDSRHLIIADNFEATNSEISILDAADGSRRVMYSSPGFGAVSSIAASPDGHRLAYSGGLVQWDVLEIALNTQSAQAIFGGGGGISWLPDWAPSGTHYLLTTNRSGKLIIEDVALDGFSRRAAEIPRGALGLGGSRWSPDGSRFVFDSESDNKTTLVLSNASGGRTIELVDIAENAIDDPASWSPDGQWIAAIKTEHGKHQVVKIKPAAGSTPVALPNATPLPAGYGSAEWSPAGDWILYPSADGMSLVSPDGAVVRKLTPRRFAAYGFSKDGSHVLGILFDTSGNPAQWQIYSLDVKTGAEKMLGPLDLPASTRNLAGFTLHPDGKRFLTSVQKAPSNVWMLEGFSQGRKTWRERLLRR